MSLLGTFNIGATGLVAQSIRLNTTASNLANADSVSGPDGKPYRSRQVVFTATQQPGSPGNGVAVTEIIESAAPLRREYKPGHPKADSFGYVDMPNVNPTEEMVNMIGASRAYEANVQAINATRAMWNKALEIGR